MAGVDYSGMTVNERLVAARLVGRWDAAIEVRDRTAALDVLNQVELASQAADIVDAVLADPQKYGFRS
jgi:hypothetical protein